MGRGWKLAAEGMRLRRAGTPEADFEGERGRERQGKLNFRDIADRGCPENTLLFVRNAAGSKRECEFEKNTKKGTVTVPCHRLSDDLGINTAKSIFRQANIKED
jgi:hypothetical protein